MHDNKPHRVGLHSTNMSASEIYRVFLCGAHCTGKTTLLRDVSSHLRLKTESEVARTLLKSLGYTNKDIDPVEHPDTFENLQVQIIKAQLEVDQRNEASREDYLADRGVDPIVYTAAYLGEVAEQKILQLPETMELIKRLRASLLFVVEPHAEIVEDDGIRMPPSIEDLRNFTGVMKRILNQQNIPYIAIKELDRETRVRTVIEHVRRSRPDLIAL